MDRAAPKPSCALPDCPWQVQPKDEKSIIQRYGFSHYASKMVDQVKVALEIGSGKVVAPL